MTSGAHEPNGDSRATVKAMSAYGIPQDAICAVLDISKPTLHKYYRREIDTGTAQANAKVAETLYRRATGGGPQDVAAMIFWLKARAGWSERVEVSGPGGGPIETKEAAVDKIARILARIAAREGPADDTGEPDA